MALLPACSLPSPINLAGSKHAGMSQQYIKTKEWSVIFLLEDLQVEVGGINKGALCNCPFYSHPHAPHKSNRKWTCRNFLLKFEDIGVVNNLLIEGPTTTCGRRALEIEGPPVGFLSVAPLSSLPHHTNLAVNIARSEPAGMFHLYSKTNESLKWHMM